MSETDVEMSVSSLDAFVFERVLSTGERRLCCLGSIQGKPAIAILEKTLFSKQDAPAVFSSEHKLTRLQDNAAYSQYSTFLSGAPSLVKVDLICPCQQFHIAKYSSSPAMCIAETPQMYAAVTKPHIASAMADLDWVYNILEFQKEKERLLLDDEDFGIWPDTKWLVPKLVTNQTNEAKQKPDQDKVQQEKAQQHEEKQQPEQQQQQQENAVSLYKDMYCLLIVKRRDLSSIRDLNHTHLPLLHSIKHKVLTFARERFGLAAHQLRLFFHYLPSFYHLHLHITNVNREQVDVQLGRSHSLDDIIDNITIKSDYYQCKTLHVKCSANHPLAASLLQFIARQPAKPAP